MNLVAPASELCDDIFGQEPGVAACDIDIGIGHLEITVENIFEL